MCTNRRPEQIAPCLDALARQAGGVGALVVCSALDSGLAEAHARAARALLPGVEVVREPRAGLSHARNRALAACADTDVLAFVDDDALAGPAWLARLAAAWSEAPAAVACIGGPVRPRFTGARPEWLTDSMLPALSMLDYGAEPQDLDPRVRTIYGANASFRCGPLRQVGGLRPRLRPPARPDVVLGGGRGAACARARRLRDPLRPDAYVWHVCRTRASRDPRDRSPLSLRRDAGRSRRARRR